MVRFLKIQAPQSEKIISENDKLTPTDAYTYLIPISNSVSTLPLLFIHLNQFLKKNVLQQFLRTDISFSIPSTRKQKEKEKHSRQSDVASDLKKESIRLRAYSRIELESNL